MPNSSTPSASGTSRTTTAGSEVGGIPRLAPRITAATEFFWTSGATGVLRILRCTACGFFIHPPLPLCPMCESEDLAATPVSGRAVLYSYTINHQQVGATFVDPFVIAIVELEEQPGLRLTTNLVDCPVEEVAIGMPLSVSFERLGDVHLPMFAPGEQGSGRDGAA